VVYAVHLTGGRLGPVRRTGVRVWAVVVERLVSNLWAVSVVVAMIAVAVFVLAHLVLTKRQPGDHITIRLFPPKIEVRGADPASSTTEPTRTKETKSSRSSDSPPTDSHRPPRWDQQGDSSMPQPTRATGRLCGRPCPATHATGAGIPAPVRRYKQHTSSGLPAVSFKQASHRPLGPPRNGPRANAEPSEPP
jgi:hypothetical protein